MKLFYKAGACSLAPHIVMAEMNMVYEIEAVDLKTKTCASGDFLKINKKGSIPALIMEDGKVLTESAVIVQYLADLNLEMGLIPNHGTTDRYRCLEWLNFIATDLHKNFTPLFTASMIIKDDIHQAQMKQFYVETLKKKIAIAGEMLGSQDYVMGEHFTVADAYLFTVLGWGKFVGVDISSFKNLESYLKRVASRPAVQRAMKEEGIL